MSRLLPLAGLLFLMLGAAQGGAGYLYVVSTTGDWVVVGDSTKRTLQALDRVPVTARIAIRPGARVDTTYAVVLRNPQSLRIASWECKPATRCRQALLVSRLPLTGGSLATSRRTGGLFIHIGETNDERSRIKIVGARGEERDWGLVALLRDSGVIDVAPLTSKMATDDGQMTARFCEMVVPDDKSADDCRHPNDVSTNSCELGSKRACRNPLTERNTVPVDIRIHNRVDDDIAIEPAVRAFGVISSRRTFACSQKLLADYSSDLASLRGALTDAEFRALERAAAAAVARKCG